jgi:hypothetical protein
VGSAEILSIPGNARSERKRDMVAATIREIHRLTPEAEGYLGPAAVVEVHPHEIVVSLPDGSTARAQLALALPYVPTVGDVLLVIGKASKHYAIGLLHGSGLTALAFQGCGRSTASSA